MVSILQIQSYRLRGVGVDRSRQRGTELTGSPQAVSESHAIRDGKRQILARLERRQLSQHRLVGEGL
jgi:hypothetical protein